MRSIYYICYSYMPTSTFDLYNLMERNNVLLAFKGTVTSELLESVFQIMESKMDDLNDSPATKKKVFNVLVECLQNLYHHIDDFDNENVVVNSAGDKKSAIFSIIRNEDAYNIVTGNFIYPKNVEDVTSKIDYINSLNRDELKAYYKEVLNNGELSEKGGGGLGLIDIAKKSRNKLQYSFREIDEDYSFFTLTVKILK
ncbi:SiaB family protein kinase [Flavobacteriales bacterium]|nr:SiaB family protein kinase [Flavobacteriales bacterium]